MRATPEYHATTRRRLLVVPASVCFVLFLYLTCLLPHNHCVVRAEMSHTHERSMHGTRPGRKQQVAFTPVGTYFRVTIYCRKLQYPTTIQHNTTQHNTTQHNTTINQNKSRKLAHNNINPTCSCSLLLQLNLQLTNN
jgi:hypothetical protein